MAKVEECCQVQVGYISRIEAGHVKSPGQIILAKIAAVLNVPSEILGLNLSPQDLITPDLPNAANLADMDGGIEVLLASYFLKIARTKNAKFWLDKETK